MIRKIPVLVNGETKHIPAYGWGGGTGVRIAKIEMEVEGVYRSRDGQETIELSYPEGNRPRPSPRFRDRPTLLFDGPERGPDLDPGEKVYIVVTTEDPDRDL